MPKISLRNELVAKLQCNGDITPLKRKFLGQLAAELFGASSFVRIEKPLTREQLSEELVSRGFKPIAIMRNELGRYRNCKVQLECTEWTIGSYTSSQVEQGMSLELGQVDYDTFCDISYYSASSVADYMQEVDKKYEEWHNEAWDEYVAECRKRCVAKAMTGVATEALVKAKLEGSGIKFYIDQRVSTTQISFLLAGEQMMQISFATSKMRELLDGVTASALEMNELLKKTDRKIKLSSCSKVELLSTRWIES